MRQSLTMLDTRTSAVSFTLDETSPGGMTKRHRTLEPSVQYQKGSKCEIGVGPDLDHSGKQDDGPDNGMKTTRNIQTDSTEISNITYDRNRFPDRQYMGSTTMGRGTGPDGVMHPGDSVPPPQELRILENPMDRHVAGGIGQSMPLHGASDDHDTTNLSIIQQPEHHSRGPPDNLLPQPRHRDARPLSAATAIDKSPKHNTMPQSVNQPVDRKSSTLPSTNTFSGEQLAPQAAGSNQTKRIPSSYTTQQSSFQPVQQVSPQPEPRRSVIISPDHVMLNVDSTI